MGNRIRTFLRDLFGSRLAERLEYDLLALRQDMENRLQDKDQVIADLRTEKAELLGKIIVYERTLLPLASRAGADVVNHTKPRRPNFGIDFAAPPVKSNWQRVQDEWEAHLAEQEQSETKQKAEGA